MLPCFLFVVSMIGCGHNNVDPEAARKLSDEFMSDLIAHRTDAAFNKMEPEFTRIVKPSDFAPQMEKLFQYCGGQRAKGRSGWIQSLRGRAQEPHPQVHLRSNHESVRERAVLFLSWR
jgi:hypothetical protein